MGILYFSPEGGYDPPEGGHTTSREKQKGDTHLCSGYVPPLFLQYIDGVTLVSLLPYSLTATSTSTTPKVIDRKSNKEKMLAMRLYRIRKKHYQSRKRLLLLMSLWCSILSTVTSKKNMVC